MDNELADNQIFFESSYQSKKLRNGTTGPQKYRGSKYIGVSGNGKKWQIFVHAKGKKYYSGQARTEIEAARYYDRLSILNNGFDCKTNYWYTVKDIKEIFRTFDKL